MTKAFFRLLIYGFLFIAFSTNSLYAQNLAAAKRGGKWFFIDKSGVVATHKLYDSVGERFVNGLAPALTNGKWGYINTSGKMVIANKFSQAFTFYNGKALVKKDNSWFIINTKGKTVYGYPNWKMEVDNISEGIVSGKLANEIILLNLHTGDIISYSTKQYSEMQPFSHGLARVKNAGKYGFIDTSGALKIPCKFDAAADFKDTITSVEIGGFYHIINTKGEIIEPLPHIYHVVSFNRGIAALPTPFQYTVYRSGGTQIKSDLPYGDNLVTTYVYPFSEDVALFFTQSVSAGFRFGYLLANGKLLNPYRYEWARDFSHDLAAVKLNGKYGYINTKGDMVIDAIYDDALSFYPVK